MNKYIPMYLIYDLVLICHGIRNLQWALTFCFVSKYSTVSLTLVIFMELQFITKIRVQLKNVYKSLCYQVIAHIRVTLNVCTTWEDLEKVMMRQHVHDRLPFSLFSLDSSLGQQKSSSSKQCVPVFSFFSTIKLQLFCKWTNDFVLFEKNPINLYR